MLLTPIVMTSRLKFLKNNMLKCYCKETVKDTSRRSVSVINPPEQFVTQSAEEGALLRLTILNLEISPDVCDQAHNVYSG